jgi:hypothetical protein
MLIKSARFPPISGRNARAGKNRHIAQFHYINVILTYSPPNCQMGIKVYLFGQNQAQLRDCPDFYRHRRVTMVDKNGSVPFAHATHNVSL